MPFQAPSHSGLRVTTTLMVVYCFGYASVLIGFICLVYYFGPTPADLPSAKHELASARLIVFFSLAAAACAYAVFPLLPRRPWTWRYGASLLIFGLPSPWLPVALPLVLRWCKPENRFRYGMRTSAL